MSKISDLQNEASSLEKLAAMRRAYSDAKNLFYIRTIFAVLIAIVFPYLDFQFPKAGFWLALGAMGYLFFDELFLKKQQGKQKLTAAKIQESFDTEVLEIGWNKLLVGSRPDHEDIARYLSRIRGDKFQNLMNWYPETIDQLPRDIARFACQRENVFWDAKLRRVFKGIIYFSIAGIVFTILSLNKDKTAAEAAISLATFLPLIKLLWEEAMLHKEAASRLDRLKENLDAILNKAMDDKSVSSEEAIHRQVQDEIFRNRSSAPFVPDCVYWLFRNRYEDLMYFSAEKYIDSYNKGE